MRLSFRLLLLYVIPFAAGQCKLIANTANPAAVARDLPEATIAIRTE